jgi:hypothetical protein
MICLHIDATQIQSLRDLLKACRLLRSGEKRSRSAITVLIGCLDRFIDEDLGGTVQPEEDEFRFKTDEEGER